MNNHINGTINGDMTNIHIAIACIICSPAKLIYRRRTNMQTHPTPKVHIFNDLASPNQATKHTNTTAKDYFFTPKIFSILLRSRAIKNSLFKPKIN